MIAIRINTPPKTNPGSHGRSWKKVDPTPSKANKIAVLTPRNPRSLGPAVWASNSARSPKTIPNPAAIRICRTGRCSAKKSFIGTLYQIFASNTS